MHTFETHYSPKGPRPKKSRPTPKSKKPTKRWPHFIFWSLALIGFGVTDFLIFTTSILPLKYLLILIAAEIFILLFTFFLILPKKIRLWAKIIADIISILSAIASGAAIYYIASTMDFLNNLKPTDYYVENYQVYVLQNSPYQSLSDLEQKNIASYIDTLSTYDQAFAELKTKLNFNTSTEISNTYTEAAIKLLEVKADFILLSDSAYDILSDYLPNFKTKTRSVYSFEIKFEITDDKIDVDVTKEPFNIYISGIDTAGRISTVSRSDVNMIVTINPKAHKILLTSIPRDYYVQLHGTTGARDKLTHAGIYGINMTVKTVGDFINIKMNYYVRVNFRTVVELVDAIGGITVETPVTFSASDDKVGYRCYFYANTPMDVDGGCALAFARERKAYAEGDVHRIQNQQQVLTAIINKIASPAIISNYTNILNAISDDFETNLPTAKIYDLINFQLDQMPSWQIESYNLNGTEAHDYTYTIGTVDNNTAGDTIYWVMEPDWSTVETARNKINALMSE